MAEPSSLFLRRRSLERCRNLFRKSGWYPVSFSPLWITRASSTRLRLGSEQGRKLLLPPKKIKAAVLGAHALLPHRFERYAFTDRSIFGGEVSFEGGGYSMSFGDSETPPLSEDIVLTESDKPWLEILATKLSSDQERDRKHIKALEYFYRA